MRQPIGSAFEGLGENLPGFGRAAFPDWEDRNETSEDSTRRTGGTATHRWGLINAHFRDDMGGTFTDLVRFAEGDRTPAPTK